MRMVYRIHAFIMTSRSVALLIGIVLLAANPTCWADTLISNLGETANTGFFTNSPGLFLATDFRTNGLPSIVTAGTVRVVNGNSFGEGIALSIYTNNGGIPGTPIASFDMAVMVPAQSSGDYSATTTGISLLGDTTYWLVFRLSAGPGDIVWNGVTNDNTDPGSAFSEVPSTTAKFFSSGSWQNADPGNFIYSLQGTQVPEPSSLGLLLSALVLIVFVRRPAPQHIASRYDEAGS